MLNTELARMHNIARLANVTTSERALIIGAIGGRRLNSESWFKNGEKGETAYEMLKICFSILKENQERVASFVSEWVGFVAHTKKALDAAADGSSQVIYDEFSLWVAKKKILCNCNATTKGMIEDLRMVSELSIKNLPQRRQ